MAAPAWADTPSGDAEISMPYNGVDFTDSHAVHRLYNRLSHAAWLVCESQPETFLNSADRECHRRVLTTAVKRIDEPKLSALDHDDNDRRDHGHGQSSLLASRNW